MLILFFTSFFKRNFTELLLAMQVASADFRYNGGGFCQAAGFISTLPLHLPFFFPSEVLRPKWPIEFYYFSAKVSLFYYFCYKFCICGFFRESTNTSLILLKAFLKTIIELFAPLLTLTKGENNTA